MIAQVETWNRWQSLQSRGDCIISDTALVRAQLRGRVRVVSLDGVRFLQLLADSRSYGISDFPMA